MVFAELDIFAAPTACGRLELEPNRLRLIPGELVPNWATVPVLADVMGVEEMVAGFLSTAIRGNFLKSMRV